MSEREPNKEIIDKGELFYLTHPGTQDVSSGCGLTMEQGSKAMLAGILMVDRPLPADPTWLEEVEQTFGEFQLVPMTETGERGITCQMQIEQDSLPYLRQLPNEMSTDIKAALEPLLEKLPNPIFSLSWDEDAQLWRSRFASPAELPPEIREVFENAGYGCLAAETNIGVVHVCHAPDVDIEGFANKPVLSQWQLVLMPTAPLVRLDLVILDDPVHPFKFESFLNIAQEDQAEVLDQLASQDELYLAFYGDGLSYRFTKTIEHDEQQWQQLDELVDQANDYWDSLPAQQRDFDKAKLEFMRRFI